MEEQNLQTKPSFSQVWYERLDKYLFFLITGELGYLILLGLIFACLAIVSYTTFFWQTLFYNRVIFRDTSFLLIFFLLVALFLNMVGGFWGIVFYIASKHQGYPGTGHLLNWLLCATNFWTVILVFLSHF